ncbi:AsmA family protein [Desulfobacterales bacterium HSG17]|nr:AsmA family protein [Desulfobacterales bacterium HSG17]
MKINKLIIGVGIIMVALLAIFSIFIHTVNLSDYLKTIQDVVYQKTGRKLAIKGDVKFSFGLTTSIQLNDISFANADGLKTDHMLTVERIEAALEIKPLFKKKIVIKRLLLENAELILEKDQNNHWNYLFAVKEPVTIDDKSQNSSIQDSNNMGQYGLDIILSTLVIKESQIQIRGNKSNPLPPIKVDQFEVKMEGINQPIDLSILAKFDYLNLSAKGTIGAIAKLIKTDQFTPFKLDCMINDSDMILEGNFTRAFQSERHSIDINIQSNNLDLISLIKQNPEKAIKGNDPKKDKGLFSTTLIDNKFLELVDLKADIDIKNLILPSFPMNDIKSNVVMKNSTLHIHPFSATLFKGNLHGDFKINSQKNGFNISSAMKLKKLDTELLIKQFDLKKDLQGLMDINWQLKGNGNTVSLIMASLDGPASLSLQNGKIETGFIQSFGADIFTNVLGFLNPLGDNIPYNTLNCATTRLEFKSGIGEIKVMIVDLPKMTASGIGTINLKNETLDILVKPSPKKGIGTKEIGKINLSISNLAKAFTIQGKITNPVIKFDHTGTTTNILKTIGGIVLLGPVGIITPLIGASKTDINPCPCAIQIAETGNNENCIKTTKVIKKKEDPEPKKETNPFKKVLSIFD